MKIRISMKAAVVMMTAVSTMLLSLTAMAGVSYRNGNFFIGYSDLVFPAGMELKIERVYNSKSSHDGIFGFGWGSDYEVYLKVSADGSVVVYENGGGAQNRFVPPTLGEADINHSIEAIAAAKAKIGGIPAARLEAEKKRMKTDAGYRNEEWDALFAKGLVQPRQVAEGTVFRSNRFSYQTVKKIKAGYMRFFDNGQVQTFDNVGRLVKWADKNNNWLAISYDKTGHMAMIQDNLNRRLNFKFNQYGKVEKIWGEGKECSYRYANGSELIWAKDSSGEVFEYKYSGDGRHNFVEIKYADKTSMQIAYNSVKEFETVKSIKDRDGGITEYTYGGQWPDGTYTFTALVSKGADGKVITKSKYEYWDRIKPDGERYTQKLASDVDGEKTVTVYNEIGMPSEITRNNEKTSFEYDAKGHVVKKSTPGETTELAYDSRHSKVSKVVKYPGSDRKKAQWAEYKYDDHGNLATARNSEGKSVKIVYDHFGRIKALVDQNKRQLQFKYNEANRPIEIADPKVGKIQVKYNNAGDIQKVDSSGGRKIALQVTSAFQNLLDIIRPAGVTLSF